ncbi:creatininase family protein [candidate division KSB1 bacterium]|nr:creatininase family protein [candidate division KSB1 bacterium]
MEWIRLTSADLKQQGTASGGVCIVPFGCLEKHSDHLPLGTDSLLAYKLACLAAEKESAVVFPPQHYMMVASAAAQPGAVVFDAKLSMQICETVFDEIARNGFSKIILYNFHGGNRNILPLLVQNQLPRRKDNYVLYLPKFDWVVEDIFKEYCVTNEGGHADEWETSLMLFLFPDLVFMDRVPEEHVGNSKNRLAFLTQAEIKVPVGFYADYPTHYAGNARAASAATGKRATEAIVNRLARVIRVIKNDEKTIDILADFLQKAHDI